MITTQVAKTAKPEPADHILESVVISGDLSKLTPLQRTKHYVRVCHSMGLNPYTQPFAYLTLQGKTQLYAKKDATDQLRKIHNISIEIVSRELVDGIYTVRARSSDPNGRKDEDEGSVPLPDNVKGEFRSNMMMKATTKAKRRVTLSHCGLAFLDETEIESIPDAKDEGVPSKEQLSLAQEINDEIPDHSSVIGDYGLDADPGSAAQSVSASAAAGAAMEPSNPAPAALSLEDMAREAARRGPDQLRVFFNKRTSAEKKRLREIEAELVELYPPIDQGD